MGVVLAVAGFMAWQRHRISALKTKVVEGQIRERTLARETRTQKNNNLSNEKLAAQTKVGNLVQPGYVVTLESFLMNRKEYQECAECEDNLEESDATIGDMMRFRFEDEQKIKKLAKHRRLWRTVAVVAGGVVVGLVVAK